MRPDDELTTIKSKLWLNMTNFIIRIRCNTRTVALRQVFITFNKGLKMRKISILAMISLLLFACGKTESAEAVPKPDNVHDAQETKDTPVKIAEKRALAENNVDSYAGENFGKYDIRGLKIGMHKDRAKKILDELEDSIVDIREAQFNVGPIENSHHAGYLYQYQVAPTQSVQVLTARKPSGPHLLSIFRAHADVDNQPPLDKYLASLKEKYGEPSVEGSNNSFLWMADTAPNVCEELVRGNMIGVFTHHTEMITPTVEKYSDCGEILYITLSAVPKQGITVVSGIQQHLYDVGKYIAEAQTFDEYWTQWLEEYNQKNAEESEIPEL